MSPTSLDCLNDAEMKVFNSAMMVVSVMGMFLRTSTGLAVAQKVYSAACWVATAAQNALNISYGTFLALTGVGIAVIVAAAAAMAYFASSMNTATASVQNFNSTAAETPTHTRSIQRASMRRGSSARPNIKSYLNRILIPAWGGREFASIKRSDVAKLLDDVEDKSGAVAADFVLAVIRGICNWYAMRMTITTSPSFGACVARIRKLVPDLAFSKMMSCGLCGRQRMACSVPSSALRC